MSTALPFHSPAHTVKAREVAWAMEAVSGSRAVPLETRYSWIHGCVGAAAVMVVVVVVGVSR